MTNTIINKRPLTITTQFRQMISFDRASGLYADLYKGMKPVKRAVMVVHSDQFPDRQFSVFITGNEAMNGDQFPCTHRFEKLEDAIAVALEECKHHKLIGEAETTFKVGS